MAIITISRGTFSGGKAVAETSGVRLGYPCISKEVLSDAAEEFGVPEEEFIAALETPPKAWRLTPTKRIAHLNFVRYALLKRARKDDLVYHGYVGHLLLSGISHVLRVRVIADMGYRIRAAIEQQGLTRKQAVSMIANLDKQSRKWTRLMYGVEWQDPSLYDVVINLEQVSTRGAVDIIVKMNSLDDFKPGDASRKAFRDQLLSSRVWVALAGDHVAATANVRVTSDDGNITITGSAGSARTLSAIDTVAMKVEGVKQVTSEVGIGSDWHW